MTNTRLVNIVVTNMLVNNDQELSLLCKMRQQCYMMNL